MLVVARADLLVRVYPHYNDTIQFDRETVRLVYACVKWGYRS